MLRRPLHTAAAKRLPPSALKATVAALAWLAWPVHAQEAAPAPASPAAAEAEAPQQLDQVVVRSRNRIEKLQDVPLSVSVVSGNELERLLATDVSAITKRAANVNWNPGNPRQFSLSIRGIGKQAQTDAQDPSVGIIIDGVNLAYNPLASSVDFADIDAVEVTRGPQGTLLGKNTSLGVINITTRKPSFEPGGSFLLSYGQRHTLYSTATYGGTVIDDLLAWRGTISAVKGRGDVVNRYNDDLTYANRDRLSGRLKLLFTPTADFNALLSFDAQPKAGEASNGRTYNTPTPTTYANGATNTLGTDASTRLNRRWFLDQSSYRYATDYLSTNSINADNYNAIVTGTDGASAELNWKLADHTLTSISAFRDYYFDARNDEGTPFDISKNGGGLVNYQQASQELRLTSKTGGFVDYQTGLFYMKTRTDHSTRTGWGSDAGAWFASNSQYSTLDATPVGRTLLGDSLNRLYKRVDNKYNNQSAAWYGQANWHLSEPLTVTTGLRITRENRKTESTSYLADTGAGTLLSGTDDAAIAARYPGATAAQIAAARALRSAQVGKLWGTVQAESFQKTQPAFVLSPTYKFNDDWTGYVSWQYGQKAGISQVVNGNSFLTKAEKTNSYEIGFKSLLLNKTLVLNTNLFLTKIRDYQQAVYGDDPYTTAANLAAGITPAQAYVSYTGNVPKVQARGLEFDGAYGGIRNVTLRFSGAFNDAVYKEFTRNAQPAENGNLSPAYRDVTGQQLPGASRFTFNVGADYRVPVLSDKLFHASFNTAYNSKYNSDNALSSYGWVPASSQTDLAIGLGRADAKLDVSLVVKNAFNDKTPTARTWNSYNPAVPRWFGITVSGKI
jgi:outer membrane receptor protein involved in Fe transport